MMAIRELKVCLLGDTGVGKSSIVCRFVQDHFDHNISPTIGASFMTKTVPCGNELHKFLIWDTAGQERFHSLAPMYYRGSAAAVIVYDITKQDSFHTLKKWVKELKEHGPENIVMAIAGNKCDLSDLRSLIYRCSCQARIKTFKRCGILCIITAWSSTALGIC
ncbi:ras-related protein Rab-31 isoform X2 [Emydura macquarii macquarii]|uniref:ras-related protein Rab-31 isoform X2 n=1 Tax=Emydura macquarii macquarii TaxID=1129001 RepID=UPI00352B5DFF